MADFVAIAAVGELQHGQMKRIVVGGKRLLLCNSGGKHYVIDEMCSHEERSLYLGCIKDGRIKCSLHGSYFDLASGEPTCDPADVPIGTYPVRIEAGLVWVKV